MTLPLPGETETGFKIIRPFTPINRLNMTAWMAGQSDATGTTRLIIYRFPRQTTVFGPQQVDVRINQDPEISTQFTLLNRSGSRLIRGNLLVIPVEQTVLYVQPVYLRATGSGGSPTELTFVIVATNTRVEMRPTLEEALAAVAGAEESGAAPGGNVEGLPNRQRRPVESRQRQKRWPPTSAVSPRCATAIGRPTGRLRRSWNESLSHWPRRRAFPTPAASQRRQILRQHRRLSEGRASRAQLCITIGETCSGDEPRPEDIRSQRPKQGIREEEERESRGVADRTRGCRSGSGRDTFRDGYLNASSRWTTRQHWEP